MHGRLNHIHPIIADGKAKKLANVIENRSADSIQLNQS